MTLIKEIDFGTPDRSRRLARTEPGGCGAGACGCGSAKGRSVAPPCPGHAAELVTLEIDGKPVTVPAGTSVMRAAVEAGVSVPKLCATDSMKSFGSCRLCLVEIEGRRGTPASCTTPAEPGMKVRTQSPKLAKLRRGVMELYQRGIIDKDVTGGLDLSWEHANELIPILLEQFSAMTLAKLPVTFKIVLPLLPGRR